MHSRTDTTRRRVGHHKADASTACCLQVQEGVYLDQGLSRLSDQGDGRSVRGSIINPFLRMCHCRPT